MFLQLFSEDTEISYNSFVFLKILFTVIDQGKLLWKKLPYMSVALRVHVHIFRVSFPKSGQNLNKQAAEKGFVGEQGRPSKKTLAGGG